MGNYSRDQVMDVITSVMGKVNDNQVQPLHQIHDELSQLSKVIDDLHADIMATRTHDVSEKHLPTATDELDAVVGATEEASAQIMDSCETIQELIDPVNHDIKDKIYQETTKIFEACSFQDITGQRITKVVSTLKEVELAVDKLLGLFGDVDKKDLPPAEEDTRSEDEKLKNGPQLAGQGVSQDEIDKLLAEFD